MQKKLIATGCTISLLLIAAFIRKFYYPHPSLEVHYYFSAFFLSAGILICIWCTVIIRHFFFPQKGKIPFKQRKSFSNNRRDNYRIEYKSAMGPKLQVQQCNNYRKFYSIKIVDLSKDGIQIKHNGLFRVQDMISGHIIFSSNEKMDISGTIIRISGDMATLYFNHPLPSELLVKEQRRLLSSD